MRVLIAAVFFCCSAAPCAAANWKVAGLAISDQNRTVTFVDVQSLSRRNGTVRFRSEQRQERETNGYNVVSTTSEANCQTMDLTVIRAAYYRNKSPVAFTSSARTESFYAPGTAMHWLIRRVCEGSFLSETVREPLLSAKGLFSESWDETPSSLAVVLPNPALPSTTSAQLASNEQPRQTAEALLASRAAPAGR